MKYFYTLILVSIITLNGFGQAPPFDDGAPDPLPGGGAAAIPLEKGNYIFLSGGLIAGGLLLFQLRRKNG